MGKRCFYFIPFCSLPDPTSSQRIYIFTSGSVSAPKASRHNQALAVKLMQNQCKINTGSMSDLFTPRSKSEDRMAKVELDAPFQRFTGKIGKLSYRWMYGQQTVMKTPDMSKVK